MKKLLSLALLRCRLVGHSIPHGTVARSGVAFAENRAPMRTSFIVFPDGLGGRSRERLHLFAFLPHAPTANGPFLRAERPGEPEGFFRTGYDDSSGA